MSETSVRCPMCGHRGRMQVKIRAVNFEGAAGTVRWILCPGCKTQFTDADKNVADELPATGPLSNREAIHSPA